MRILVSNDDGYDAPGLHALATALEALGEVWVVAPATEQSARSHALTMHSPLRVQPRGPRRYTVSGTPADCVYVALHQLLPGPPAIVVSGINRGPNLADDTWYSGTVGAAREGAMCQLPALAVSMGIRADVPDADRPWERAASVAVKVAKRVVAEPSTGRTVFNLNVPCADVLGDIKVCGLGARHYAPSVHVNVDPRGRRFYWIGGESRGFANQPGTDGYWFENGHPTLTPLHIEGTDADLVEAWQGLKLS